MHEAVPPSPQYAFKTYTSKTTFTLERQARVYSELCPYTIERQARVYSELCPYTIERQARVYSKLCPYTIERQARVYSELCPYTLFCVTLTVQKATRISLNNFNQLVITKKSDCILCVRRWTFV